MRELQIASNRVFSHVIDNDSIFSYQLRVDGYTEFKKLYDISLAENKNMFNTPSSFSEPDAGPGYQYNYQCSNEFKEFVTNLINTELDSQLELKTSWFLHQTNASWIDNPIHMHMTASWVAVLYLDTKEGDAIQFYDAAENMERYEPEFGEILFFPGEALHKPAPNVSAKRLTFNMEFQRPALTQEEIDSIEIRFNICKACDRFNSESSVCSECECFIPMKIGYPAESCPIDKW